MEQTKRSTFKLLFYLKKNEPRKNGSVSVMARITIDGRAKTFGTKLDIDPKTWDLKHGRVSGKSTQALTLNQKLDNIRVRISKIYDDMIKEEGFATAEKVKLIFLGVSVAGDTFLKFFSKHNEDYAKMVAKKEKAKNTLRKYINVYDHLRVFIKEKYYREDLSFRELTIEFIKDFDFFLRTDKKCAHNTIQLYITALLHIIDLAKKKNLLRSNPFEEYKIRRKETDRGYLLKEDVENMMRYKSKTDNSEEIVKDIFIFSCFTGLSYIDIKQLQRKNIQSFFDGHDWIIGRRQKSKVVSNVRLLDIPKKLIEKYSGITRNENIFPVPSSSSCNSHIKVIAKKSGVVSNKTITFHTARHTFATMLLTEGVPLESVSKMMGHTDIATTQIYAKITNQKISRDMDLVAHKFSGMETILETTQQIA
jgi:integrase